MLFATTLVVGVGAVLFVLAGSTRIAAWPAPVAVIGTTDDAREPVGFLGVADPVHHVVVAVPADAIVEIPGKGFLRAYHAWRLGSSEAVRETLGLLFGIDVPFAVVGEGSTYKEVLGSALQIDAPTTVEGPLRGTLRDASESWRRLDVKPAGQSLDAATLRAAILSLGGRPTSKAVRTASATASPSPPARIDPTTVTVDVLNGGEVRGAAAGTAAKLEAKGYRIGTIGDFEPRRTESVVYFAPDKEAAGRQVGAELDLRSEAVPKEIVMGSGVDVLVVVGDDAPPA